MLCKAVTPIAFFSLLLFTTQAGGQQPGSSNVASVSQTVPNTELASSSNLQPEANASVASSTIPRSPVTNNESAESAEDASATDGLVPQVNRKTTNVGAPIPCSVVEYKLLDSKAMLGLLCPAVQISAPLRVHLILAWKDIGDVTHFLGHKLVKIGSSANIRAKQGQSKVQLTYQNEGDEIARKQWFDVRVVSVGLEKEGNYR